MTDSYAPTFFRTAADGSVGAIFPGGVELPVNTTPSPNPARRVYWERDDGATVAELWGMDQGGIQRLYLGSYDPDAPTQVSAGLKLDIDPAGSSVGAQALNFPSSAAAVRIIGSDDTSGFVRFAEGPTVERVARGTASIVFPPGANAAATVVIPHGLPDEPVNMQMTGLNSGTAFWHAMATGAVNWDHANIEWGAQLVNGVSLPGGRFFFSWVAFG